MIEGLSQPINDSGSTHSSARYRDKVVKREVFARIGIRQASTRFQKLAKVKMCERDRKAKSLQPVVTANFHWAIHQWRRDGQMTFPILIRTTG